MGINLNINCRVCNNNQFKKWGRKDNLILYQCKKCELVFFFPYPTQKELDEHYNNNYHINRNYNGEEKVGLLRKKMYELDIRDLEKTIYPKGKFLDVGCAEGVFLSMMSNKWEKYGIDVSKYAVKKANEKDNIIALQKDIAELKDKSYDVIHLRGVFEHLLFPLDYLKNVNKKLKKSGYLVLSNTPNIKGLVPRIFRGRFILIYPNEHVNYFSKKTIEILLNISGFKVIKIKYPYFGTPYENFILDLIKIPINNILNKKSPPFWGNIFTIYAQKI